MYYGQLENSQLGTLLCSRAATAKKCTKKRDARVELLFCQSNPNAFFLYSLPSSSMCKLPNISSRLRSAVKKLSVVHESFGNR